MPLFPTRYTLVTYHSHFHPILSLAVVKCGLAEATDGRLSLDFHRNVGGQMARMIAQVTEVGV